MTDRKALTEPNETPEDVATLYSWANLHGAKYRDFSASRAQTRENTRQRTQEASEEEHRFAREESEAEAQRTMDAFRAAEVKLQVEQQLLNEATQRATRQAAEDAAQAAEQAARQRTWQQPQQNPMRAPGAVSPAPLPTGYAPSASSHVPPIPQYAPVATPYPQPYPAQPQQPPFPSYPATQAPRPETPQPSYVPLREENRAPQRRPWTPEERRENLGRPAWLMSEDLSGQPMPPAFEDTIQGSRDRLASRWFALKGVFNGSAASVEPAPAPVQASASAPVLAVFSLAGGVGKTSLVATLGRALSARGERVLLVDTAAYGLLPFFFGARDQRPGLLRTFSPPGVSSAAPIQMITLDPDASGSEKASPEALVGEISRLAHGANRVIVDLATASGATTRRVLRLAPTVLVPVVPDMNSVVSVSSIDAFFEHNASPSGKESMPYYVLNQFDPSLPLHLDVREVLREQLGDRLLPFALHRTPAVSEALAEGMTAMDYAPNSTLAEGYASLAGWVKGLAAPASGGFRGVRWSER